jgi:small conductance mechanosensitive channel
LSLFAATSGKSISLHDACGDQLYVPCKIAYQLNRHTAKFMHDWSIDTWTNKIAAILITIIVTMVARRFAHGVITKITTRMAGGTSMGGRLRERTKTRLDGSPALINERRRQRAETMGSLLRSIASVLILSSAGISILGVVGINLTPILASASIVGVAVAFGAQNLVKDFLSGIFMLLEDQYGVGDVIDAGPAKGTVEEVTLRITKLRDVNGVAWYVRNGTIQRVGNESQNWARVVLDVPVPLDADLDQVQDLLQKTAVAMAEEEEWEERIIEKPSVWGVQELTGEHVTIRVVLKTAPGEQSKTAREMRARVKAAFDEAGITMAVPSDK